MRGQFRADRQFGPSGDGDNINIPEAVIKVTLPRETPGEYPIRVFGRATGPGQTDEAFTTLWIGARRTSAATSGAPCLPSP